MNWKIKTLLNFFFIGFIVTACTSKYPGFEKAENGVYYKVHFKGNDTIHPKETDWVTVNMDYKLDDTVLFKSTMLKEPLLFSMIKPMFDGDLYEGLELMGRGDSMTFVIVADSFFYKTAMFKDLPAGVKPGSLMYYDVKLLKIITNKEYIAEIEMEKELLRQQEMEKLKTFIQSAGIKQLPLESGLYYIPLNKSKGRVADTGEMCQIHLKVQTLDGNVLFDNFNKEPMDVELGKEFDTQGLMEGVSMMPLGGKTQLIVPSSIGVGENKREGVKPFTTLIYEVELLQIRSVETVKQERAEKKKAEEAEKQRLEEEEPKKINNYIADNEIKMSPSSSGLYFILLTEGTGPLAKPGDKVKVNYTLYSLDGQEIESSYTNDQPFEFQVGSNQVIKGWEEAIQKMKKGGKAKLIVPSNLAYGARQMNDYIKPYSTLVFELELLEIN
jgi:FKBP-type peptidyl-prolyl cis-trans isomerase